MKTTLIFAYTRDIFIGNEFKPGIKKWFKNPRFDGAEGRLFARLTVENWEEVKDDLPKSYRPIQVIENENI